MGALASLLRRKRRTLFLLALTASVLYLLSSPSPSYLPSLPWSTSASHDEPLGDHPIDHLIHKNKRLWNEKLARQSRTLKEAQKEYRRRFVFRFHCFYLCTQSSARRRQLTLTTLPLLSYHLQVSLRA